LGLLVTSLVPPGTPIVLGADDTVEHTFRTPFPGLAAFF
jgi:hypothetical protein